MQGEIENLGYDCKIMSVTASPSQAIHQERDTNDQINSRMVMSVWRVFLHPDFISSVFKSMPLSQISKKVAIIGVAAWRTDESGVI